MPTLTSEFELFRQYSQAVKKFLKNTAYLSRYPLNENVDVQYATPPRAFVKYIAPVINGGNLNPTITFYLEGMEENDGERMLGFVTQSKSVNNKFESVYAPLIYKLNYKVTIMVATPSDADILQYQLLSTAKKNKKYAVKVDGQWCEMECHSPSDESSVEPGEADKIYKKSMTLTIPRAYLPMDYIEYGIIEQINVKLETETSNDTFIV